MKTLLFVSVAFVAGFVIGRDLAYRDAANTMKDAQIELLKKDLKEAREGGKDNEHTLN